MTLSQLVLWSRAAAVPLLWLVFTGTTPYARASSTFYYTSFDISGIFNLGGMNDAGQVVGSTWDGSSHAFVRDTNGTVRYLDGAGAVAINNHGEILEVADTPYYWLRYPDGTTGSAVYSIFGLSDLNDSGYVVGNMVDGACMGLLGSCVSISTPGYLYLYPFRLNNNGDVVGNYTSGSYFGPRHGFVRAEDGSVTTLDRPGADASSDYYSGINDAGTVVGSVHSGAPMGFTLLADGTYLTWTIPGATDLWVIDINNNGQILGIYYDSDRNRRGFIGSTAPEPASMGLLALGLCGLLAYRARRA